MLNSMSSEVLTSEYCKNTFLIQPSVNFSVGNEGFKQRAAFRTVDISQQSFFSPFLEYLCSIIPAINTRQLVDLMVALIYTGAPFPSQEQASQKGISDYQQSKTL